MMRTRRGTIVLVAIVLASSAIGAHADAADASNHAPKAPTNLRVDEAASPLWVTDAPTFAWIPVDTDRNEIQAAYRLLVATTPTTDPKDRAVIFDSDRVASSRESFVAAPGLKLERDHRYWWTVRTWDRRGVAGPFARPVPFDTALNDSDWHADWIRRAGAPPSPFEDFFLVRHAFTVGASAVVRARAYVSAGQQYELYVNGTRVDGGPSYSYPDEQYYQATDIAHWLKAGARNAIALIVHNVGGGQGRPVEPPGAIARVTIDHRDGSTQAITTDGTWRVHDGQWTQGTPRNDEGDFVENIDARLVPPDWASATFDDSGWGLAHVIGAHPTSPWTHLIAQRTRIVETPVKPVTFTRLASGAYVADFGAVIAATPAIALHAGVAGRKLTLLQGYLLDPDGAVSTTKGTQETDMHDSYIERAGPQTLRPYGYLGFRYLELTDPGETLTANDVVAYARHAEMPNDDASAFASSSPILDQIWKLARHSALYGSQEQFLDTPTREKGQFLRDAANTSSVTSIAFAERNLTGQALRDFARSQKKYWPDGRVNAVYPNSDDGRDIPDFTEDYVAWVLREYETTGDRAQLATLYPVIANIADYVARAIYPAVGLVTNLPGGGGDYNGGIVDWPPAMRYGYDKTSVALTTVNIQAIEVFQEVAAAASALHRPAADVSKQRARADALTKAVNARLRRPDGVYIDGLHQDGTASTHASQQANAYGLAAGIVPKAAQPLVVGQVHRLGMAMGPDIAGVLLAGLHRSGNDQALIDIVSNPKIPGWANILSRGATFTWESWNARDVYSDSESHAWGSTVLPALTADILGAQVSAPGASEVAIAPPSNTTVTHANGRLATERGTVTVAWKRVDSIHFTLDLTVPANVRARVTLPAGQISEGGDDFTPSSGGFTPTVTGPQFVIGSGQYRFVVARGSLAGDKDTSSGVKGAARAVLVVVVIVVLCALVLLGAVLVERRRRRAAH